VLNLQSTDSYAGCHLVVLTSYELPQDCFRNHDNGKSKGLFGRHVPVHKMG